MDTHCPVLRRPKRKLCYITNRTSPPKQWEGTLTLEDVDKMFDDLDSSPQYEALPPSPLLQTFDAEERSNEQEASPVSQEEDIREDQMSPEKEVQNPAVRSPSPKLDLDLDIPFKAHKPVKTSSPVEQNMDEKGEKRLKNGKDIVMSPILFSQEDDRQQTETIQGTLSNGQVTEESDGQSELESPPNHVHIKAVSAQKEKLQKFCVKQNPAPTVSAVRQETEVEAPERNVEDIQKEQHVENLGATRGGKNINDFLQKIKQLIQSKPSVSKTSGFKSFTPPTPEPEDDFLILEDDAPYVFTIPTKTVNGKRQNKTSSSDKDSLTDKGEKDSPVKMAEKQQDPKKSNRKPGGRSVNQKAKIRSDVPEPVNEEATSLSPHPAGDVNEQGKTIKKRPLKKAQSKESDKGERPKDRERRKTKTNPRKSKKSKSSDDEETTRVKSLKDTRKELEGSEAVKEMEQDEAVMEENHEQMDVENPLSPTAGEMSEPNQQPVDAEENSFEVSETLGKRKRKQTGQWWLSCSQSTEETNTHQPTVKKSKQNNKKPITAETSPVKTKKEEVLKKRNPNKDTEKKTKNKKTGGDQMKTADEVFTTAEEQEQQDVSDQRQLGISFTIDENIQEVNADGTSEQSSPEVGQFLRKKKQKQTGNKKASEAETLPVPKTKKDTQTRKGQTQKRSATSNQAQEKKRKQNKNTRRDTEDKITTADEVFSTTEEPEVQDAPDPDPNDEESSPLVFSHQHSSLSASSQVFHKVYQPKERSREDQSGKRRRKPPGSWWLVNSGEEDLESVSSQPQQPQQRHHNKSKPQRDRKKTNKQKKTLPSDENTTDTSAPQGGAPEPSPTQTEQSTPTGRQDVFTSQPVVSGRYGVTSHPAEERSAGSHIRDGETETSILCMEEGDIRNTQKNPPDPIPPHNRGRHLEDTFEVVVSGPSSMVALEEEDDDRSEDMALPSTRVHAVLRESDLCASPLRPLILQPKDKANLKEMFKILWPAADTGAEITPDQFDWFFHQDRAMGFQVDYNNGSICNGKILLGSYMKKPLWVDHCATTVFNLLTSSVKVIVDGSESCYSPGQSIVVQCGRAYSLHNVTAQPAVLFFTRIAAETLD